MVDIQLARSQLPEGTVSLFDDITKSRVLGASGQTNLIAQMFISIAKDLSCSTDEIKKRIAIVSEFFKQTRGQNSRAIYNAICLMNIAMMSVKDADEEDYRERICNAVAEYQNQSINDAHLSAHYAAHLCEKLDAIMIFDYSSTVNEMVKSIKKKLTIYIPESRALNGGKPFLKDAVSVGHQVKYIPDTAMMIALAKCQAAFIGAETLYPDGSVFNSIGSDILAVLCKELDKPLFVVSQLIKIDSRALKGYARPEPMRFDYSVRLAQNWSDDDKKQIDFSGIKLVKIDAEKIEGIVTEKGLLRQEEFRKTAFAYAQKLEESLC